MGGSLAEVAGYSGSLQVVAGTFRWSFKRGMSVVSVEEVVAGGLLAGGSDPRYLRRPHQHQTPHLHHHVVVVVLVAVVVIAVIFTVGVVKIIIITIITWYGYK